MNDFDFDSDYGQPYRLDMYGRPQRGFGDGKWVDPSRTREKSSHPYTYDEYFLFGNREVIKKVYGANYSDRLWEWDYTKAERLWKQHVNTRWEHASEAQLSAFLSEYHGEKLKVVALAEGCNPSNGYPYWVVWYRKALS